MAKTSKDYFGLGWLVSVILAIIPPFGTVLGIITRWKEGKKVAAILRIPFCWLVYIPDIVLMLFRGQIWRILNK